MSVSVVSWHALRFEKDEYLLELDVMQVGFLVFLVYNYHYIYWVCCRSEESDVDVIVKMVVGWY